jgi:hypothetical protein
MRIAKEQINAFYVFWFASAGGNDQLTEWVKIRAIQPVPVRAVCLSGK